jgi:hypothetical protein
MITLEGSSLRFRFPQIHDHAKTEIHFQRTLRIPDDGKHYPLPPGLGHFPLEHVEDYTRRIPKDWSERGGVMLPLDQAEAMWIAFDRGYESYPCAIKIAAGKINAVSGKPWKPELDAADHDYMVVPEQPWLDGFCVAKDVVRQFVAMPLGAGYSVEEQITGKPEHGGLQVLVYPMKKERYEPILHAREERRRRAEEEAKRERGRVYCMAPAVPMGASISRGRSKVVNCERKGAPLAAPRAMALAAGGRMKQQIYKDPHGIDAWDQSVSSRCFVTLVDAVQWQEITSAPPPTKPPTAEDYTRAGLPWFDYYAADLEALGGAAALTKVKSVAEMAAEKGEQVLGPDGEMDPSTIVVLGPGKTKPQSRPVRECQV